MTVDAETMAAYAAHADSYARQFGRGSADQRLTQFMALLPAGARVLDLGCGPGTASALMRAAGFHPDPVDASPEMVGLANQQHDIGARLGTFDDIAEEAAYDGVWANFSLLHAQRVDLPRHLAAIARSLCAGGILHLGMKTGTGSQRDRLGRFYTFVTVPELHALVTAAGFTVVDTSQGEEQGLAGRVDPYVILRARRSAE
jgi:SAM-dependent methyltransferase